jgi:hypothetical protein
MLTIKSSCDILTAKRTNVSQLRTDLLAPAEPPVTAECPSVATFAEDTPGSALLVPVHKTMTYNASQDEHADTMKHLNKNMAT